MKMTPSFLVVASTIFVFSSALFEKKTIRIDRFLGVCPKYRNATLIIRDIRMKNEKSHFMMNLKLQVLKDSSSDIKFKIVIDRCRSREAPDSCEPYPEIRFSRMCLMINSNMPPFNAGLENFHPRLSCPFKKGVYEMINGTIDEKAISLFPLSGWYWRAQVYMLENIENDYKIIYCSYLEGSIVSALQK